MKTLSLNSMGLKGLNTDLAPWSLSPEFLTAGINFRIYTNNITTSNGYSTWSLGPLDLNPGYLMHVLALSSNLWLIAGRDSVQSFDGTTWADISSIEGYTAIGEDQELEWTGNMLGQIPIINNPHTSPEYWSPAEPAQILQPLPWDSAETWSDKNYSCDVMRSHKNYLFALGMFEGITPAPGVYRWSHPADINGLPFTWDETDPSSLAGRSQIGGDKGAILDGRSLRDRFVIYSETGIDILSESGDEFVFNRQEMSTTIGLINKNCLVEVKGNHFFLADGDVVRNDGNSLDSIMHGRVRKSFVSNIDIDNYHRSYAVRNKALKEIWFCVPTQGAEYPDIAYIYNWRDDSWAVRDLPVNVTFANFGPQSSPEVYWSTWGGTWEEQIRTWGSRKRTPLDDTVVGCNTLGQLLILDPTDTYVRENGTTIERTNLTLGSHEGVTSISKIIPFMSGTSEVTFYLGTQQFAGAAIKWKPGVKFNPSVDRKIDVRSTGELHAIKIKSTDNGNWSLSGMEIIYSENGKR